MCISLCFYLGVKPRTPDEKPTPLLLHHSGNANNYVEYDSPSSVLMNMSLLHLFPHVALTCSAFFLWLLGCVITQHRTLTRLASSSATDLSSSLWTGSSLPCSTTDDIGCFSKSRTDSLKDFGPFLLKICCRGLNPHENWESIFECRNMTVLRHLLVDS